LNLSGLPSDLMDKISTMLAGRGVTLPEFEKRRA
jgi:hypothetical protein